MTAQPRSLAAALPGEDVRKSGLGFCWLCRRDRVLVKWLGPVQVWLGTAPMYGCLDCEGWLESMVELYQAQRDGSWTP